MRNAVLLAICLGSLVAGGAVRAAEPRRGSVFPMGVSSAGPTEIRLIGTDLKGARQLFFAEPGIIAERRGKNIFAVSASSSAAPRDVDVWVVTSAALSHPLRIEVGEQVGLVKRPESEASVLDATLPVVIDATMKTAFDRNEIRFQAERGQRTSIAVRSESLGGSVRPALTVFAPDGREVLHDSGGESEPILDFFAPTGGSFRLRVTDRNFRRDDFSHYRITLFSGPRLVAAFPQVLTKGKAQRVTLFGYGLPNGEPAGAGFAPNLQRVETTIGAPSTGDPDGGGWTPANAVMLDGLKYHHAEVHGHLRFGLVDEEVTVEWEGRHNRLEEAQDVVIGGVIAGRFLRPGEVDWYRFKAKKGQKLWIEAAGERAGLAMDLDVAIHDAKGVPVLALADTPPPKGFPASVPLATVDPMGEFRVRADGEYALMIRDLYGPIAYGVERTYWVRISPLVEDVRVVAIHPDEAAPRGLWVKPGGQTKIRLVAVRRGGHKRSITIQAEAMPAGLTAQKATIAEGESTATLTLEAAKGALPWVGLVPLSAETEVNGQHRSVPVVAATLARQGARPPVRLCEGIAAAIVGEQPPMPPGREPP